MIDTQKIRERSIVPGAHQIPVIQMLCDEVDYLRLKNKEITDLDEARERIRELEMENERLRTELEFFADESRWDEKDFVGDWWSFQSDEDVNPCLKANNALAGEEKKP